MYKLFICLDTFYFPNVAHLYRKLSIFVVTCADVQNRMCTISHDWYQLDKAKRGRRTDQIRRKSAVWGWDGVSASFSTDEAPDAPQRVEIQVKATIHQLIIGDRRYGPRWCLVWTSLYSLCRCLRAQPFDRMWNYIWNPFQLHIKQFWSWTCLRAKKTSIFV